MGQTAIEKVLARASGRAAVAAGDIVHPVPELVILHDGYVVPARRELESLGLRRLAQPEKVVFVTDHEVIYATPAAAARGRAIRAAARDWGVRLFDVGQGGHGHIFPMESGLVRPGMFLFAYDMHCSNFGAIGALALRNGSEVTTVMATGTIWTAVPQTLRLHLTGRLRPGVMARDVGFRLAADLRHRRLGLDYDYRAIEVGGPGMATLSVDERVALCNTVTELGCSAMFFPPDAVTAAWLAARGLPPGESVQPDLDARYEGEIRIDLSATEPQVALPGSPYDVADLSGVLGQAVDHAYVGSCGSGMWGDLEVAAAVLRDRHVAPGVRLFITPGSEASIRRMAAQGLTDLFAAAGAIVLPAGCGPCAGGNMGPLGPGEVSISTAAVNHHGRMGAKDARIFLANPAAVAASAVAGRITDPRESAR
ncbi:3-isopropylmalate dehydratase large subunit [Roseomonas sp. BN140053]|uniref:3-isopropylmalate dehydratase large subunit n=1 Tax=Roseomonas sp. BN140053 TaxID=3391898 RepID=UPI0039E9F274